MNRMRENIFVARENRLVAGVMFFSALAWLVLIPAFYFRNIWLLPLHEVIAWVQQQVQIFRGFGISLDSDTFRQYTYLLSQYSPCVSLASSAFSVAVGVKVSQALHFQDNSSRRRAILYIALAFGILGMLITVLMFGTSLIYLVLDIVYIG